VRAAPAHAALPAARRSRALDRAGTPILSLARLSPLQHVALLVSQDKQGVDPVLWLSAESPTKRREPCADILQMLLECLALLCAKRAMRQELRKRGVYPILRNLDVSLDQDEEEERAALLAGGEGAAAAAVSGRAVGQSVRDRLYEVVDFLIGNEDPHEIEMEAQDSEKKRVEGGSVSV
jgi:hypothetical protein